MIALCFATGWNGVDRMMRVPSGVAVLESGKADRIMVVTKRRDMAAIRFEIK
jgi:hypothetical protein